ncbi:MAG: TetR/AcrR family transcriptional regulator [Acidimicrobiales bacterium]
MSQKGIESAPGIRARLRAELTEQILATARRHLAASGAAALSLRAVARELQMAPSALYRYFPSRDDLLTSLIIEAYDAIGEAVEASSASFPPRDIEARFRAACNAVRTFAKVRPHEYSLIYGSPVPGYMAPEATVPAAARVPLVLAGLLREASEAGLLEPTPGATGPLPPSTRSDLEAVIELAFPDLAPEVLARGILVWVELFGLVSFELYGHLVGSVEDTDAFFGWSVDSMARYVGLAAVADYQH